MLTDVDIIVFRIQKARSNYAAPIVLCLIVFKTTK
jgi:hypothetical protein